MRLRPNGNAELASGSITLATPLPDLDTLNRVRFARTGPVVLSTTGASSALRVILPAGFGYRLGDTNQPLTLGTMDFPVMGLTQSLGPTNDLNYTSAAQIFARFRDEEISSETHLVMIGDVIPPSAIALFNSPIMLSSMNWTLELVTPLDAETRAGWLRFDSELTAAGDGYGWENTSIWSCKGELVALSRQCVALFG